MSETILANARLILPDGDMPGSVTLADGRIVEIAEGGAVRPGAVDCGGDCLAPGLIELHTDNLERHMQPRPGVHWPLRPAVVAHDAELAANGITTVFDALRVGSVVSDRKARYGKYARDVLTQILALLFVISCVFLAFQVKAAGQRRAPSVLEQEFGTSEAAPAEQPGTGEDPAPQPAGLPQE